jgi:hypothetical protein
MKKTSVEFLLQSFGHNLSKMKAYIIDYEIDIIVLLDDTEMDANTFCYDIEEFVKPINLQ